MSLRQIKKLQGNTKAAPEQVEEKDADEQEEEEEQPKAQKIKNVFDMFQNDDDDDDQDDDEDDEESENKANKNKATGGEGGEGKKKKKKKNKKKKAKNAEKEENEEVEEKKVNNEDDEFDKALAEFKEESKEREIHRPCLEINEKALDYNKELAKYFKGSKLTTKDYVQREGRNNRERGMIKHMKNDRNARNFKSYKLVYADTAHMFNPERFSCEMIGHTTQKMKVYALEPTKRYKELQEAFDNLRNTGDPDHLAEFARANPFHVDAMFSIAELLRLQGDYKQVNQLLENIIFMYEDSFGYEVNIFEHDDVMISYDANEYSRTLFAALNRFMDVLGKKGCYKSAFEYNKVLIKLNPYHDPAGGLLSFDYNAISSQNYDALLEFPHRFGKQYYKSDEYSLIYQPNFAYSCALAKFLKLTQDENLGISQYAGVTEEDFKQAIKTDIDPLEENANVMLMHAILLFPNVVKELAEANEYQKQTGALGGDKFSEWQKKSYKEIFAHKFWEQGKVEYIYPCMNINNNEDIEGVKKAIEIYIERSKILWKGMKIMLWVKACIGMILNQIQSGNLNFEEYTESLFTAKFKYKLPFEMSRCKGLMRSNFSDRVERIDFNNIPDNVGQQPRERPGYNPMNTQNTGFLNLLLGSLLPWNHLPRQNNNEPQDGPHDPDDVEIEEEDF